jgi:hypothetical protein
LRPSSEEIITVVKFDNRYFETEWALQDHKAKIALAANFTKDEIQAVHYGKFSRDPRRLYEILKEIYE